MSPATAHPWRPVVRDPDVPAPAVPASPAVRAADDERSTDTAFDDPRPPADVGPRGPLRPAVLRWCGHPDRPRRSGRAGRRALDGPGRRVALTVLAVGSIALGCSSTTDSAVSSTVAPPPATAPAAPTTTVVTATAGVSAYFLRGSTVGVGQANPFVAADDPRAVLDHLLAGPTDADREAGLHTDISPGVSVYDFRVEGDTAVVDLSRAFETTNTRPQVAQVVYTLTQVPPITKVRFLVDGQPNGATGVPAIGRDELPLLTPKILLESPTPGAAPARAFRAGGDTDPSLTSVPWQVVANDVTVAAGTTPANTARGATRKRFSTAIDLTSAPAGPAELVVGSGPDEVRVPILIGP